MSAMLANLLARQPGRLAPVSNLILPQTCQQKRYAKKTHTFEYAFGLPPLITSDDYEDAAARGKLEELQYREIRPARIWETNSPFFDQLQDKFLRNINFDGRRYLKSDLLHKTLYEVKTIQYRRMRKQQLRQQEEPPKKAGDKVAVPNEDEGETVETNPLALFHKAINNCKPLVITQKVKRGGATYQVPYPLSARRSEWFAIKWLHSAIKERPKPRKTHYHEELAREIVDAAHGRGKVIKKRDDIHKLAQANKAYAHYRWG